jgi:aspartate racemase
MSWESTARYYQKINEGVRERLGGLHSADLILRSVDFEAVKDLQESGSWEIAAHSLGREMKMLETAGAEAVMICTNTMHCVADEVMRNCSVPLIHIADVIGGVCAEQKLHTVALLGTRYTMEEGFLKDRIAERFGGEVIVPGKEDRIEVHRVIYEELCIGKVLPESTESYTHIIERLAEGGAQAVIYGCTEIEALFLNSPPPVQAIDSTTVHAEAGIEFLLSN